MFWKYLAFAACITGTYIIGYTSGVGAGRRESVSHGEEMRREAAIAARKTLTDAEHKARELQIDSAAAAGRTNIQRTSANYGQTDYIDSFTPQYDSAARRESRSSGGTYSNAGGSTYIQNINYNIQPSRRQIEVPQIPKNDERRDALPRRAPVHAFGDR